MELEVKHPFLTTYLRYVENTESPRLYHIWSALACISAAMGRRCWLPFGLGKVWPNMYVVLSGPPATRKGAAIDIPTDILREVAKVKFAPNDTGGQRQGLIKAMIETGTEAEDQEILDALMDVTETKTTLNSLSTVSRGLEKLAGIEFDTRDPYSMFASAGELNSFIGENSTTMLTFLQEMWDGKPYKYQLKNTTETLQNGLLSILAGTTPSQISISMPPQAVGGGFTSRIIFVHGNLCYKRVARPTLDSSVERDIKLMYAEVFNRFEGEFVESPHAAALFDEIYYRGVTIQDSRFLHYCDRRGTHLKKVAMALAASRGSQSIEEIDVDVADKLLMFTEKDMPDALGEYGISKLSAAKQRILEFIRNADGPISTQALCGYMSRDVNQMEFRSILADLHNTKKVSVVMIPELGQCVIATDISAARIKRKELGEITTLLKAAEG